MNKSKSAIRNPQSAIHEGLIEQANQARERAYAPYSGFRVGAALLAKSGRVYTGCNIENAAYSPTICAERVALGTAIASGEPIDGFSVIAVVGGLQKPTGNLQKPTPPCGVCRQVLSELAPGIMVVMASASASELGDDRMEMTIKELLPYSFEL